MGWIRVDDHFDEHPKLAQVGPVAWGVWLAGLAYCNRNLTDGYIPWSKARALCLLETVDDQGRVWRLSRSSDSSCEELDASWVIGQLVSAGLWEPVEKDGVLLGYRVHDYADYQPSRSSPAGLVAPALGTTRARLRAQLPAPV